MKKPAAKNFVDRFSRIKLGDTSSAEILTAWRALLEAAEYGSVPAGALLTVLTDKVQCLLDNPESVKLLLEIDRCVLKIEQEKQEGKTGKTGSA